MVFKGSSTTKNLAIYFKWSAEELIERVHSWNARKATMKPAHILAAWP